MAFKIHLLMGSLLLLLMHLHMILTGSASQPFRFIQRLEGSRKGQIVDGLNELKHFLKKFGYLSYDANRSKHANDDEFDDHLEYALTAYQTNYQLNVTGSLDTDTVNQMVKPRCGVADNVHHKNTVPLDSYEQLRNRNPVHEVSHYAFFPRRLHWPEGKTCLTYRFNSSIQLPASQILIRSVCSHAFQRWAEVTHFTFQEVPDDSVADIQIGFHRGDHGDGYPFDGPGGCLAHASAPTGGNFHYDADENWSTNPGPNEMDLESIAVHEIGHLLGLQHSFVSDAVMFPYIGSGIIKRNLHADDIKGIRTLYGL